MAITTWLILLLTAVPPLTDVQRTLLAQTTDHSFVDEPGLYGLLPNVLQWPAGDEAGAAVLPGADYAELAQYPAAHRGDVFLIEGRFLRARRFGLVRPGKWGDAVTEWALQVPGRDEAVVVFFVDPDGKLQSPALRQPVRLGARFYKIWSDTDQQNQATDYLVFVARWAKQLPTERGASGMLPIVLLALVLLSALVWMVLRIVAGVARDRRRALSRPSAQTAELLEESEHLPHDPADALAEMDHRGHV